MIIGSGGAGKSTLARKLSAIAGLELYHLDRLFWQPGWTSISKEELGEKVKAIVATENWIIDGNYSGTMDLRMEAADTIIYLDLPTIVCLWGIMKRWLMYRNRMRPDMTEGCSEKIDLEFFNWVLTFKRRNRKNILARLKKYAEGRNIVVLRNRSQVNRFIDKLDSSFNGSAI
ncbi:MAG: family ATPase [Clostridia bacterium]|nr:family ATPase [Clostridia bacterium]